jgi:hypothetical protein
MEGVKFEDEKRLVAVAVGSAFEASKLVVDAFEFPAGDGDGSRCPGRGL